MTYRCTKCDWKGDDIVCFWPRGLGICPECGSPVEDLDLEERIAIRREAGQSEEEATEKAKEEIERWRNGPL